jgi:rubrerythrin
MIKLEASDFKEVHNGLCSVRDVLSSMAGVVSESLLAKLAAGVAQMERGLDAAYEQESEQFNSASEYFSHTADKYGFSSVWSIYDVTNFDEDHHYRTALFVEYHGLLSKIEGTSWLGLWRAAEELIERSGDTHHIYVEGFKICPKDRTVLNLITGS